MPAEEHDLAELSSDQQDTLQTYIAVTGQEPSEAIPLLRRSEWNAQIAITKFFDGEGPDLLAEAQAMPSENNSRITQNLMEDLHASPDEPSSASHSLQPAPRLHTQPSQSALLRPPFLLSIIFSPFNFLYRILASSFRLFGALFPFLPRILNSFTASINRNVKGGGSGRRTLGPKDTAIRFIREFEEEYGPNRLPWMENGYEAAMSIAKNELKILLILLLSPENDDTDSWVRGTLLDDEVQSFISDPGNNLLLWGGNVQDSEAYQVASLSRCTKLPYTLMSAYHERAGANMVIFARIPGLTSPSAFLNQIRKAVNQTKTSLDRVRSTRAEQQASRAIREQQDTAYERSLAIDRERLRQRREAAAEKERLEKEQQEKQDAAEKFAQNLQQWKAWRAQSILPEPLANDGEAVSISIRLPTGERIVRRFPGQSEIEELYAYVECHSVLNSTSEGDSSVASTTKPENFEQKYNFRLVSPMPRIVFDIEAGGTVKKRLGRGGNLLVEPIDDDSSEDEN